MPALATDLLLIARNPLGGRLRNRTAVEKGLRAALFVELIMAGHLTNQGGSPHAVSTGPLDDPVLETVRAAVADRPGTMWRRWYHHAAADRAVLTKTLVADGRWTIARDAVGRVAYDDREPDASLALSFAVTAVADLRQAPADRHQAALALISTLSGALAGRPHPRVLRDRHLALLDSFGALADPLRRDVQAALTGCAAAIRHRARVLG